MSLRRIESTTVFAPWSLRIVSLSAQLLAVTLALHRFTALPTAVAINLMAVAFVAAGLAGLGGLAALTQIWRFGLAGTSQATFALLFGAALLVIPAYYLPVVLRGGANYDASTDAVHPPSFETLGKARQFAGIPAGIKPVATVGPEMALEPVLTARSASDVFDLANDLMRQLDLNIVSEQAPGFGTDDGTIEATERTLVLGLTDDISIRISSRDGATRADIRSAARYPHLDLGRNAERVQLIARKLQASIDASVPTEAALPALDGTSPASNETAKLPGGTAGATTVLRRKKRVPSPPNAPNAPRLTAAPHRVLTAQCCGRRGPLFP